MSAIDGVMIGAGVVLLLNIILWWKLTPSSSAATRKQGPLVPSGVTITAQPPLTDTDVYFYNLLCLAVQDQYLVLAQVPLWCLVDVQAVDAKARAQVFSRMALKRVDFVLVHPGTRGVEAVVQLVQTTTGSVKQQQGDRLVETVLQMARLKLFKLKVQESYTVPDLAKLLGMEAIE
jgi:hypothetical protein